MQQKLPALAIPESDPVLQILPATEADIPAIWDIVSRDARWLREQGMTHWSDYYTEASIADKVRRGIMYVLFADGKPVGTEAIGTEPPDYYRDNAEHENHLLRFTEPDARAAYPTTLAIDPEYHGKGYAKMLIEFMQKTAKEMGAKYIRFDARGDYTKLIALYEKLGFVKVGEMPDPDSVYFLFEKKVD